MAGRRNITAKGWNWKKTETQLQKELLGENCAGKVNKSAMQILKDGQTDFIKSLPASEETYMPFITGNLHDSIASVISANGRVVSAVYTDPVAKEPSLLSGREVYSPTTGGGRKRIIGALEAATDIRNMQGRYPMGVAATMIVAVPYAENPNEFSDKNKQGRHVGYLDTLGAKYIRTMERAFSLYDKYDLFRWKGGRLSWNTPINSR